MTVVVVALAVAGGLYLCHTNDLGLTGFDTLMGKRPEMSMLRTNTQSAADAFLASHKNELTSPSSGSFDLAADYSKTSKLRRLGYRSSFYYYCWNIYRPYSLRTASGENATVIVQVSDDTQGHGHDPHHFHVVRVIVLDSVNQITKTLDGEQPTIRLQARP